MSRVHGTTGHVDDGPSSDTLLDAASPEPFHFEYVGLIQGVAMAQVTAVLKPRPFLAASKVSGTALCDTPQLLQLPSMFYMSISLN